ncbi:hypothetical protein [Sharpea azabuensis]|uniref:hypothetical protein n=1 Tax=Sharpea azabuensis TaxID=322505 RepID=UPI00156B604E|nr:hypothetical protein [Sharpea azabuensis]
MYGYIARHKKLLRKILSTSHILFGLLIIIIAFTFFPNDSSWGSIYAIIGSLFVICGTILKLQGLNSVRNVLIVGMLILCLFGFFNVLDYISVVAFKQVPRFSYIKRYGDHTVEYQTLFYKAIQKYPDTKKEYVYIAH